MSTKYASRFSTKATPQTSPIPHRAQEQIKNAAGGFVFKTDDWERLDRFLILGTESNTYYTNAQKLTVQNAECVLRCATTDPARTIKTILRISHSGRAPKNDPALFALALCASHPDLKTRQAALMVLPAVARIGTHLFHFAEFLKSQRGWSRMLRTAIGNWYNNQSIEQLTNQVMKYQQRDGWANRDLLRLAHPKTDNIARKAVYDWICGRKANESIPSSLKAMDDLMANPNAEHAVALIYAYDLPRECIPTILLNDVDVWAALLSKMPLTAMIRNLGKMTSIGLLKPLSKETSIVVDALASAEAIKKARLHPLTLLVALRTYAKGKGDKGSLTWTPLPQIVEALDSAFYTAFETIEPTGKRIMLCLDVSGSMTGGDIAGMPIKPYEGTAALAMVTARTEKNYHIMGFTSKLIDLGIHAKMDLGQAMSKCSRSDFGSTDCALPMKYAKDHKLDVDAFIVITDNETWAGRSHPVQALADYRKFSGINSHFIVVGMTATECSIADPKDPKSLNVVGFDSAAPQFMADFIRG